jgi:hypothetical protein
MSMLREAGDIEVVDVDAVFYTLIPSRFPPVKLFERIANDDEGAAIARIETLTNPRLRERRRVLQTDQVDVTSPKYQNWNHAPFTYRNPEGSRYFGPEPAVLELSDDLQTALAISVRKRETFLSRTSEARTNLDMRVLTRQVTGRFGDLRHLCTDLDHEKRIIAGRRVLELEPPVDGLLYRTSERPSATCIAILDPKSLGRAVQGDHFRFVWDGERIRSVYSFSGPGRIIDPQGLASNESVLAA